MKNIFIAHRLFHTGFPDKEIGIQQEHYIKNTRSKGENFDKIGNTFLEGSELSMSLADILREVGMEIGLKKGMEEGRE